MCTRSLVKFYLSHPPHTVLYLTSHYTIIFYTTHTTVSEEQFTSLAPNLCHTTTLYPTHTVLRYPIPYYPHYNVRGTAHLPSPQSMPHYYTLPHPHSAPLPHPHSAPLPHPILPTLQCPRNSSLP